MSTPPDRPRISVSSFSTYVIIGAFFAGMAIVGDPRWPVIFGVLGLCALVAYVFYFAWSRGIFASDETETETSYESLGSRIAKGDPAEKQS